jgi:23S rRNA pseudouridine1911/1915/1917 synthase
VVRTAVGQEVEVSFPARELDGAEGMRVDAFLAARLKRYSRSAVQSLIAEGKVSLRGARAKASTRLKLEDVVVVRYPRRPESEPRHAEIPVLYEDERLLVVDKPGDIIVHPTDRVVRNTVLSILREQTGFESLYLAHRLDRETSGVLALAKDAAAAASLQSQFESRRTRKVYLAVVRGVPAARRFTVDAPLARAGGEILVKQAVRDDGAPALTEFRVLAAGRDEALVLARPRSGRLHQIRVHLAHAGVPILGDKLYCGDGAAYLKAVARTFGEADALALGAPRQLLHARSLVFSHPAHGRRLRITAPLPGDFRSRSGNLC